MPASDEGEDGLGRAGLGGFGGFGREGLVAATVGVSRPSSTRAASAAMPSRSASMNNPAVADDRAGRTLLRRVPRPVRVTTGCKAGYRMS